MIDAIPEEKVIPSQQERAAEVKNQIESIIKRLAVVAGKKFKKVAARTYVQDTGFLLFVIQTMSIANAELKEEISQKEQEPKPGELVGLDGRVLSKDEPLIAIATS